jgi:hypothetical protein
MAIVKLTLDQAFDGATEIVLAVPIDTPEQRFVGLEAEGFDAVEGNALNSEQQVPRLRLRPWTSGEVRLSFDEVGAEFPDWTFDHGGGSHETPAPDLVVLMNEVAPSSLPQKERVERVIRHVEERFTYGVRDIGLGDDLEAMPARTCGIHKGTCIDTHSYGVAAFRAASIPAAYISGLFFEEGARESMPGHCWMAVKAEGAPHDWDVSHFLKYNLGPVRLVLNPKPGIRFSMAVGRGTVVEGEDGPVTFSRLSGFNVLSGPQRGQKLTTRAELLESP